jgi:hypothetical protein
LVAKLSEKQELAKCALCDVVTLHHKTKANLGRSRWFQKGSQNRKKT